MIKPLYTILCSLILCAAPLAGQPEVPPTKKLKILVVTSIFPKRSETFVVNQIEWFLNRGHDVSIYANKKEKNYDIKMLSTQHDLLSKTHYKGLPSDIDTYDIILCQFGTHGKQFVEIRKQKKFKAKIVTIFRGYDISKKISHPQFYNELFELGDLFLPICEAFKQKLITLGAPEHKIEVHYDAIDCSKFTLPVHKRDNGECIKFVSIGRLIEKKGIADALHALHNVAKRYPHISYTIIGTGPLMSQLKRLATELGLVNNVTFAGWQLPGAIAKSLPHDDIFLLPCVTANDKDIDGTPNSIIEAMACGLPVISTTVSGIPEVIKDGVNGYVVSEHAVVELSKKIEFLIEHPEIRQEFGRQGRSIVENKFEMHKNYTLLEALFIKAVSRA